MKYISHCGMYIIERLQDSWDVKLSPKGIKSLGMFYVYIPRINVGQVVSQGQIVVNVETSSTLCPLKCPIGGTVEQLNNALIDAPFTIGENTPLFRLSNVPPETFNTLSVA